MPSPSATPEAAPDPEDDPPRSADDLPLHVDDVPTSRPAPSFMVDCWNCDTPNEPSRTFCIDCGSFIAIGSKAQPTSPAPQSTPESPPPRDAAPLGSYATAMQRQQQAARRRGLVAAVSVVLVGVVGAAALSTVVFPSEPRGSAAPAAALLPSTTAPADAGMQTSLESATTHSGTQVGDDPFEIVPVAGLVDPADLQVLEDAIQAIESDTAETDPAESTTDTADTATDTETEAEPDQVPEAEVVGGDDPLRQETGSELTVTETAGADGTEVTPDEPEPAPTVLRRDGWVCAGEVELTDPRGREWSLGRVSFLGGSGYERVVLHLTRIGRGSGESTSVTAEAIPTSKVPSATGLRQPSTGKSTVSLLLSDNIEGKLGLRGYRPSGVEVLKEFSVYPAAEGSSRVLISTAPAECFRLRVPAWSNPSAETQTAQIQVDIRS